MAGVKGRSGGDRPTAPQNNPANISATGGAGQSGTQPARYISGMPYGEGGATMRQQQSAPMAGPAEPTPLNLPPVTPLTAPTERPNEPISHGMDFGAGPGSEVLNIPQERPLSETLAAMIPFDSTGDVQAIYDFAVTRGL